jgi:hypothetical protein
VIYVLLREICGVQWCAGYCGSQAEAEIALDYCRWVDNNYRVVARHCIVPMLRWYV